MAESGFDSSLAFKSFSDKDVNIAKTMVRLRKIEAAGDKNKRMEMRGVKKKLSGEKEEVSECKESTEKISIVPTEWKNDFIQLWMDIDILKKVNDERGGKFTELSKERSEWNKERTAVRKEIDNLKK